MSMPFSGVATAPRVLGTPKNKRQHRNRSRHSLQDASQLSSAGQLEEEYSDKNKPSFVIAYAEISL